MKSVFEKLNELYDLDEANNFGSDRAKSALVGKYNKAHNGAVGKSQCILHHLNGNHDDDRDLANDVLIVAGDREEAKAAHKLLHLLSYCLIEDELRQRLKDLNVEFFYQPDYSAEPQPIELTTILNGLAQHDRKLRDIALLDQDEETLDSLGKNGFQTYDKKIEL